LVTTGVVTITNLLAGDPLCEDDRSYEDEEWSLAKERTKKKKIEGSVSEDSLSLEDQEWSPSAFGNFQSTFITGHT